MTTRDSHRGAPSLLSGGVALVLSLLALPMLCSAAVAEPVVVTNRVIHPGEVIGAADLSIINTKGRVISDAPFASGFDHALGKVAERTILPQRLILLSTLRDKSAISAGELVPVTFRSGALVIRMDAVALSDAAEGQAVTLRNRDTGRQIEALAQADGTAVLIP